MSLEHDAAYVTPRQLVLPEGVVPVWLPGDVEVQVAGESFHSDAILAALFKVPSQGSLTAVLVPERCNPYSKHAVAVYLEGQHAGYLPDRLACDVQPVLLEFAHVQGGRPVSCPARVDTHDIGHQVVLQLDPTPRGLSAEAFDVPSQLAMVLNRLLVRLDQPPPRLDNVDTTGRQLLSQAEQDRQHVDADYSRSANAWARVERVFRRAVDRLTRAEDPLASLAWLGVAHATRYQRGRRDDALAAYIEALYLDREHAEAWCELVDFASAAPHVPTFTALLARCPVACRESLLSRFLAVSYQSDRLGNMGAAAGKRFREAMLSLVERQGDRASIALLCSDQGLHAEKAGDIDTAIAAWRRAVQAGCTDANVADRLSFWLTKHNHHAEALHVLRQALSNPPQSTALRERLRKRLARCQHAVGHQHDKLN